MGLMNMVQNPTGFWYSSEEADSEIAKLLAELAKARQFNPATVRAWLREQHSVDSDFRRELVTWTYEQELGASAKAD